MENTAPAATFPVDEDEGKQKKNKTKKNYKRFVLLKSAISLLRRSNSDDKQKSKPTPPPVVLNQILGSIRPLHLPDHGLSSPNCSSPAFSDHSFASSSSTAYGSAVNFQDLGNQSDCVRDVDGELMNRGLRKTRTSSFASAMNLLELGSDGESDDDDEVEEQNHEGDEMIDRKADEFIANFYSKFRVHKRK